MSADLLPAAPFGALLSCGPFRARRMTPDLWIGIAIGAGIMAVLDRTILQNTAHRLVYARRYRAK